ncbi:MAG: sporulation stage III protein AG [Tissierellia bacterium]|nr:sporulation stage III protein AG [Tissierellia bacterium]
MDKLIHKLKALLEKMDNKKIIYNSFIILIIGIIFLIIANIFLDYKKDLDTNSQLNSIGLENTNIDQDYTTILERKLEEILGELKGVGKVKVMVTLEDTIEKVPAFNTNKNNETTSEIDSQGGTREIVREDMSIQMVTSNDGNLMFIKEIKPTVRGVIVIAEGAENLEVKEMLYEAVKTVLGISGNRVEVYSSK